MVYLVQEPTARRLPDGKTSKIDVTPAAKFGEFKVLLPEGDVVISTAPTVHRLKAGLRSFSDEDYLLLIGDPVAIGMAVAVAAKINNGRVKVLRWLKRETDYIPIQIEL